MTLFKTLLYHMETEDIALFLKTLPRYRIRNVENYFLFEQPRITDLFEQSIQLLSSPSTLPVDFLALKKANVVAMTIDGNFICASNDCTWLISRNFYLEDCEVFPYGIVTFFKHYFARELVSHIID